MDDTMRDERKEKSVMDNIADDGRDDEEHAGGWMCAGGGDDDDNDDSNNGGGHTRDPRRSPPDLALCHTCVTQ